MNRSDHPADCGAVLRWAGEADLDAWQAFVDRRPSARAHHHAAWYRVLGEAFSVKQCFLLAEAPGEGVCGVLPLYESHSWILPPHLASLEGGALADSPEVAAALQRRALELSRERRLRYLLLRDPVTPETALPGTTRLDYLRPTVVTATGSDRLWQGLSGRTRNRIGRAERAGIAVATEAAQLEAFYAAFAARQRAHGTPTPGLDLFRSLRRHLDDRFRLYTARHSERLLGGILCVAGPYRWEALYGALTEEGARLHANYALYWALIRDAAAAGVGELDLGRSRPESPTHVFKRQWAQDDRPAPYDVIAVNGPVPSGVEALQAGGGAAQRLWRRLPLGLTKALGPILRRQLPLG